MTLRRHLLGIILAFTASAGFAGSHVTIGDDGLHKQDWFYGSELNLADDLREAAAQDKGLLILYEQVGCIYCAELHGVNFNRDEITDLIRQSFLVVQLDLNGDREVVDFDGSRMSESDLATKWSVMFTPTTLIFSGEDSQASSWQEVQAFRLPGYLKPFYYFTALDFFASGEIAQQGFKTFLSSRVAVLDTQGVDPELW